MIITVHTRTGESDSTTVADEALAYKHTLSVARDTVEKAIGFAIEDGDVVEAVVDGRTYRCTVSEDLDEQYGSFGLVTSVGGKDVEHSLSIEHEQ